GQYATVGDCEGRERESGGAGGGDVRGGDGERDDHGRQSDDQREWRGDGGELDVERHGGPEHAHRHLDRLERQPRDLQRDGDGGHGGHDCGEQCDEPDGDGGHGGQYAAVGDREGREREPGDRGGSDVRRGARERDDRRREPDHERQRHRHGGELDAERDRWQQHPNSHVRVAHGEPGHLYGDGDGGGGGDDRGEQCDEPVGHGGDGGQYAAVGDREGCERESGGAGGGDVRGGPGERDDYGRQSDDQREWGGDGGELDAECHGGPEHAHRHVDRPERQPRDVHGDGGGGRGGDDRRQQRDEPVGHGGDGGQYAAVGDREGCERESGGGSGGDVHPGGGEWQRDGRDANHERQRHRHGGELDAERDRWQQHPNGHVRVAHGEPGHVYGDGDSRGGGDHRAEQPDQPDSAGGDSGEPTAVGDREGRERESGGAGGGDVRGGPGERDDHGRQSDDQREWGGDGGELDAERHGGPGHAARHLERLQRQHRDLQGYGD